MIGNFRVTLEKNIIYPHSFMKTSKQFFLFTITLALVLLSGYSSPQAQGSGDGAIATETSPIEIAQNRNSFDCDNARTQTELNLCAAQAAHQADQELNSVYQELKAKIKGTSQERRLIKAQRTWIQFRDQDCDYAQRQYDGGTMMPMIYGFCVADLTEKRTQQLEYYLEQEDL